MSLAFFFIILLLAQLILFSDNFFVNKQSYLIFLTFPIIKVIQTQITLV